MLYENKKNYIGIFLFIVSIVLLGYLVFNKLSFILFTIDEYFTFTLINLPVSDMLTMTANDVHPPLYYLLVKFVLKLLNAVNFNGNVIYILRLLSMLPFLIILAISGTKIKKEYGWLVAGLTSFTLIAMSGFMYHYIVIRMYSWAILFSLLSFIYFKDILNKSDIKSWLLFSVFVILGAYTHYFAAITSFTLYFFLFVNFIKDKNLQEIKKLLLSGIFCIIVYLPWLLVLINQIKKVHNDYWIPQVTLQYLFDSIMYFALITTSNTIITILALFALIIFYVLVIREFKTNPNIENHYILYGILAFILTLVITVVLSYVYKPILRYRYLLPSIAIFWFAISIYTNKIDNKVILGFVLSLILILGCFGVISNDDSFNHFYGEGIANENLFEEINSDNATVFCIAPYASIEFGTYLQTKDIYSTSKMIYGVPINHTKMNYVPLKKIDSLIDKNNGTIFIIKGKATDFNLTNKTLEYRHSIAELDFYSVNKNI
ncbi:hypothetical protein [Methanobrevibacter sp.]|uniref:glycosyltransferase family 39 protein n=1 Tax=Methanobrevibacter sp. TaxID=66852 RepID=UPI00386EF235